jgi:hypothetical protein
LIIESTELGFFLKDLRRQNDLSKPEDAVDVAINFFKQILSCSHVVGTSWAYVIETIHNRKSLVYSLTESFKGFDDNYEITPNELFTCIEIVCPGFPKSIVLEAAMLTVSNINHLATLVDTKCIFIMLFRNVACYILYDEWIKSVEETFRNDGKGMFLATQKLKMKLEDFHRHLSPSVYQPLLSAVLMASEGESSSSVRPQYSDNREISFDAFKKSLFKSSAVITELEILSHLPSII